MNHHTNYGKQYLEEEPTTREGFEGLLQIIIIISSSSLYNRKYIFLLMEIPYIKLKKKLPTCSTYEQNQNKIPVK